MRLLKLVFLKLVQVTIFRVYVRDVGRYGILVLTLGKNVAFYIGGNIVIVRSGVRVEVGGII